MEDQVCGLKKKGVKASIMISLHKKTSFFLANFELSLSVAVSGDTPKSLLITLVRFKGPCDWYVLMDCWANFLKA